MSESDPMLPTEREWKQRGIHIDDELHAGKQSRVFGATVDGRTAAVKLTNAHLTDRPVLMERMRAVEALAGSTDTVLAPMRLDGELVQSIGGWLLTATPFVAGRRLDAADLADAQSMGRELARLHDVLARLPRFEIPPVAALEIPGDDVELRDWQLLHADFSEHNTVATADGLRVFDFDDCGYGPVAYDVASSLYMVLFDSEVNDHPGRYEAFRSNFLAGYDRAAPGTIEPLVVDTMIEVRIRALARWIDDLATAPIGIRTSSPAWLQTLRAFVDSPSRTGEPT